MSKDITVSPTNPSETLLDLINHERSAAGVAPLQANEALTGAAQAHALDMAKNDYFSHASADGRSAKERAAEHGYTAYGAENIARGQRIPEATVLSWMNSAGHRRNLLNPDLIAVGLGVAERAEGGPVWVAKFGRQDDA
ncbi:CAP domain-containing protein [Nocardiopsis alba]|uniref:CAP domain-containing protein n=1 Tax=Nocardiopsis alba TaxID=53437 RepID=UPI0033A6E3ED